MPVEFQFDPKLKETDDVRKIFDPVRKKWVVLTPEEWVRQYYIAYLNEICGFPISLMKCETSLGGAGRAKRSDLILHSTSGQVLMLCEFKRKGEKLNDAVIFQAARYNKELKAGIILLSDGESLRVIRVDQSTGKLSELDEVPRFAELSKA
jgi:hypothetical protein